MKNINQILVFFLANLLMITTLFAQAPEKMNYQAVARDLSGLPLVNAAVNLQFDILQGSTTGTVAYSETQAKTTNQFGLFTAEIGAGSIVSGDFSTIAWGSNAYFLRITVNGDVMPATQLLSVPYALYSKTSGGAGTSFTAGSGINITGGIITSTSDTSAINELQNLSWNTTDSNIIDISNGVGMSLASNTPALNQVLTWNGVNWIAQNVSGGWAQGTGNDIYNNTDSVGIGTTDPKSLLQLGDFMHFDPLILSGTEEYSFSSYNAYWDGTTVRNTSGGTSGISILGHDNGNPVYSVMLYPTQAVGTDLMAVNPFPKFNLKGKGFVINGDNPSAALEVNSIDSASIFMAQPDDGSRATLTYTSPSGNYLGLRVPNTLVSGNYTLTYPTALPGTSGAPLVSDLVGNLSWGTPVAPIWSKTGSVLHPAVLADNVGIGSNSATYPLEIKRTQAGTAALLGLTNPSGTGDAAIHFSTGTGNFSIGRNGNTFKIAHASNLGSNVRMTIGSTGNVGFGTTAPSQKLDVVGTAEIDSLRINNSYSFPINAGATGDVLSLFGSDLMWQTPPPIPVALWTRTGANIHPAVLTDNFGVGTNGPSYPIEINKNQGGTSPLIGVVNTNATGDAPMLFSTTTGNFMMGADGNSFKIASSSTNLGLNTRMTIGSTGNIGFGTAAPVAKVHSNAVGNAVAFKGVSNGATNATLDLINNAGGPSAIFWNGFVGIGLTPTARFHSNGTLRLENLGGLAPVAGSVLTAIDVNGNAQWQAPAAAKWTGSAGVIYPVTLTDNIGIGTNSPGMIAGSTNYLTIASTGGYSTGSVASLELKGNTNAGNDVAAKLDFLNGIGTSNIARIEARTAPGNTGEGQLVFYTDNGTLNEAMRVDENGLLGVGTNNPSAKLHLENGHFKTTQTSSPTIVTASGIASGGSVSISGTDVAGQITLNSGTPSAGPSYWLAQITFDTPMTGNPVIILTARSPQTAGLQLFAIPNGSNGFWVGTNNTPGVGTNYQIFYMVMER